MPGEVADLFRCAVAGDVVRRGAEQPADRRELARDEARIGQLTDADGHVEAFGDDIGEVVGQHDVQLEIRMVLHEAGQMRRDMHAAEGGRRRNAKHALRLRRAAGGIGFRLLDARENAEHAVVEALARLGQRDLPGRALQQARAQPVFQPLDPFGDDGWGKSERPPCCRHTAGGNDACKNLKIA